MTNIADLFLARSLETPLTTARPAPVRAAEPPLPQRSVDDMLEAIRLHLDMDVAFISRQIGSTHRIFSHVSAKGTAPLCAGDTNQNDNSICWLVIQGKLPQRICDTSEFELSRHLGVVEELGVRSHFSVPMLRRDGTAHGSLCCFSHRPRPEITERDMQVLRSVATLVSDHIEGRIEHEERQLLADQIISEALDQDDLVIVHQPIVQIDRRELIGHECLLRRRGRIDNSPLVLFSDAALAGRSFELEMLAARRALDTIGQTQSDRFISINVSPRTLVSEEFLKLLPSGMNQRLVIEVTEQQAIEDYEAVKLAIERIKQKAWVAIDDVGGGFASLRHLVQLDADILKIDREFVEGVAHDPALRALTTALVQFAAETGSTLIAEGVETRADLEALQGLGVRFAQGFLLGRPAEPRRTLFAC